ncbi:MAG: 50S ribosomal protein L4 [Alphaproteobacteria bacterium]|nr:MAG: 50S ribosomal protein L4 [Alphaproteobacteria bacterium]
MQLNVTTLDNKSAGQIDLKDTVFALTPLRKDIMARVVNWQLAKRQAGTHKTKEIGDVSGRKAKPWAQKGTGRARQGSLRSPQFRGGATIFGPVVRSHGFDLPKKFRALGLKMALSAKAAEGKLVVVDTDQLKDAKTASVSKFFDKLGVKSALFIGGEKLNDNFAKAAANVKNFDALPQVGINVYDIIRRDTLILTKDAVDHLHTRLGGAKKAKAAKAPKAKAAAKTAKGE